VRSGEPAAQRHDIRISSMPSIFGIRHKQQAMP
jgi:hypothetical protein